MPAMMSSSQAVSSGLLASLRVQPRQQHKVLHKQLCSSIKIDTRG
jgi:hypothetical protein